VTYEFLTADTVGAYIAARPELSGRLDASRLATVAEIGDGNLNLVFVVKDDQGRGLVLKQALPYVRLVGPEWPMTPQRAQREARALACHGDLIASAVPALYHFDDERCILAIEDLSDHQVWRSALNAGLRHDGVAERMGEYLAAVAFGTSVFAVDPEEHKQRVAAAINPELCTITEDLVFTEPYADAERNSVLPANDRDVAELAADGVMVAQMGAAKWAFMTHAEALIHGDLHTGSVMVRAEHGPEGRVSSAKAFDSEFAFYGPVAFDIGALWANYTIAAARAVALGDDDRARWCLDLTAATWAAFEAGFRARWPQCRDPRVFTPAFLDERIAVWRSETWLFAAAKMARRVVGLAKASDIETLDPVLREGAARGLLRLARAAVRERQVDSAPSAYIALAEGELARSATR